MSEILTKQEMARWGLLAMEDSLCGFCGEVVDPDQMDVDHHIPLSLGGTNEEANLRPTHRRCNRSQGAYLGHESYRRKIAAKEPMVATYLRLPKSVHEELNRIAREQGRRPAQQVTHMLKWYCLHGPKGDWLAPPTATPGPAEVTP